MPEKTQAQAASLGDAKTLRERAYTELRQMILAGQCAPGMVFTQRELAAQLGMSRTPVRDAVLRLEQEGLLKLLRGGMAAVSTAPLEDMKRTYEVRALLEGFAARQATGRIDATQLEQLKELVAQQETMIGSVTSEAAQSEFFRLDNEFHWLIITNARNPRLSSIVSGLMTLTEFQTAQARAFFVPGRLERSVAEHRKILRLVSGGDAEEADRALRTHLEGFCGDVIAYWMR
jgi:DNA-binding GntR family transcriptional regulator